MWVLAQSAGALKYIDRRGVRPRPNDSPRYDIKSSDGKALVMLEL